MIEDPMRLSAQFDHRSLSRYACNSNHLHYAHIYDLLDKARIDISEGIHIPYGT
jgi:hypothetical protein